MNILHICNDFLGTTAHESLYRALDDLGIIQTIFVPRKKVVQKTERQIEFKTAGSAIVYSVELSRYHKVLYGLKIRTLVKDIERKVNLSQVDIIHSPILCNEGAVAYELHKAYHIPYMTAVRNADVNGYIKVFKWRKGYFKKIVLGAERVVFISSLYPARLKKALNLRDREIDGKSVVVHNGMADDFLENRSLHADSLGKPVKVVMTGAFGYNKNIHGLFSAVKSLRTAGEAVELSAIGNNLSTNPQEKKYADNIAKLAEENDWFKIYDAKPRSVLYKSLREYDVFALVSFHETFGLSYIEALSQGLPVVYTRNEGFDGTYEEGRVGYSASAYDVESIAEALRHVIAHYKELVTNVRNLDLSEYSWADIAKKYQKIYSDVLSEKQKNQ